jgi:hypothetical protein
VAGGIRFEALIGGVCRKAGNGAAAFCNWRKKHLGG